MTHENSNLDNTTPTLIRTFLGGCIKGRRHIVDFIIKFGIPNGVNYDDLHTTILFSDVPLPDDFAPQEAVEWIGTPIGFNVWPSQTGNSVLVCQYESKEQYDRHHELREEYGVNHNHPDYNPHVTLSYDIEDFDVSQLDISEFPQIVVLCEFQCPLKE